MYGIWSKNIDLALINKKMVAIFLFRIGGKQRNRVKAGYVNMIYKPQEIDRCGKFRRKRGNADQKL